MFGGIWQTQGVAVIMSSLSKLSSGNLLERKATKYFSVSEAEHLRVN